MKTTILSTLIIVASILATGFASTQSATRDKSIGISDPTVPLKSPPNPPAIAVPSEVKVSGAKSAKPGELVVLTPEGIENSRSIWNLNYPEDFEQWKEENGKLFIAMPRKRICFSLFVVPNDQSRSLQNIRFVVDVNGLPDPDRGDEQDSDPGPNPGPVPSTTWDKTDFLILIEESSERTVDLARMIRSKFWQTGIADAGLNRIRIYDKDDPFSKDLIGEARKVGDSTALPFMAVIDKEGSFKRAFPATKTIDELKEVLGL